MTFFGCEDEYDTDIPNSSQISYRHHVPAATLLCLNVYCQYVLSSKANFNKFCSELWLVWKNRCLKSGTKLYGCPNWKKVCYPIWCQKVHMEKNTIIISSKEKDSIKTCTSLYISQSTVRGSHRKLKFINSYVHRPVFVFKL